MSSLLSTGTHPLLTFSPRKVMYVPGGRWRFFGRFNHPQATVVQTWWQLDEFWMSKYLKPSCYEDICLKATPFTRVKVHKTGNKVSSVKLKCVKEVVLKIIPADDAPVRGLIAAWDDEVDFRSHVGTLSALNTVSSRYKYNAMKASETTLLSLFETTYVWKRDVDYIIRPTDINGPQIPYLVALFVFEVCIVSAQLIQRLLLVFAS
jgi:hypothetical protein